MGKWFPKMGREVKQQNSGVRSYLSVLVNKTGLSSHARHYGNVHNACSKGAGVADVVAHSIYMLHCGW